MSNIVQTNAIESALIQGDLSKLNADQRLSYYKNVCESVGLNPLTKPFEYINLNGKLTLYAKRDATDQLRKVHKVSVTISDRQKIEDLYIVTAKAKDRDGREDESTGAVNLKGLSGDALANALMKAETKAKRRVTLSVCGLGMLDETEVATIEDAREPVENPFEADKLEVEQLAHDPGLYEFKFGKFKGQRLKDLDIYELNSYCQYIHKKAESDSKPIQGTVKEALEFAEAFLKSRESGNDIPF